MANSWLGLLTVFKPKPHFLARTEENRNHNFSWAYIRFQLWGNMAKQARHWCIPFASQMTID